MEISVPKENPKVLWLDDEPMLVRAQVKCLLKNGYDVDQVKTVTKAERKLKGGRYDLLILDIAIPVTEEEESRYPPIDTRHGHMTGFYFYSLSKDHLRRQGTKVLLVTSYLEYVDEIGQRSSEEGLPVVSLFQIRKDERILDIVDDILSGRQQDGARLYP